jgi:hypothetical protein
MRGGLPSLEAQRFFRFRKRRQIPLDFCASRSILKSKPLNLKEAEDDRPLAKSANYLRRCARRCDCRRKRRKRQKECVMRPILLWLIGIPIPIIILIWALGGFH